MCYDLIYGISVPIVTISCVTFAGESCVLGLFEPVNGGTDEIENYYLICL